MANTRKGHLRLVTADASASSRAAPSATVPWSVSVPGNYEPWVDPEHDYWLRDMRAIDARVISERDDERVLEYLAERQLAADEAALSCSPQEREMHRERLHAELEALLPSGCHGAVDRAREVILELADAAWTVLEHRGTGPEAQSASHRIDAAMRATAGRDSETRAVITLVAAVAEAARVVKSGKGWYERLTVLSSFAAKWPEHFRKVSGADFEQAALAWAGVRPRKWRSLRELIGGAGLSWRSEQTLMKLCRKWEAEGLLRVCQEDS